MLAVEVLEYQDAKGLSPFGHWFNGLNGAAAARVAGAANQKAVKKEGAPWH